MKKIQLLFMMLAAYNTQAQTNFNFEWAVVNKDNNPKTTVVDQNGNIFVAGTFNGTVDADMTSGVTTFTSPNLSSFIAKYDADRNFLWARHISGDNAQNCYQIYLNQDESSVCVLGEYTGTIYGNPDSGIVDRSSQGGSDIYIARFNTTTGNLQRLSSIGTAALVEFPVAGQFDNEGNQFILFSQRANGLQYLFLYKITPQNTLAYQFDMGTYVNTTILNGSSLGIDSSGFAYVCGYHRGQVAVKAQGGSYLNLSVDNSSTQAVFTIKVDDNGFASSISQYKLINTTIIPRGFAVAKTGEIYLSVAHSLSVFSESNGDRQLNGYLLHYNKDHRLTWATRIMDTTATATTQTLTVDERSNVFLSGLLGGSTQIVTLKGASSSGLFDTTKLDKSFLPTTLAKGQYFLLKMDSTGDIAWLKQFDLDGEENLSQIIVKNEAIYTTGYATGTYKPVPESTNSQVEIGTNQAWYISKYNENEAVGLHKHFIDNQIEVNAYPNPCNDVLTISAALPITMIQVYNTQGAKVKEIEAKEGIKVVTVYDLTDGIYFMHALTDKRAYKTKIIVKH